MAVRRIDRADAGAAARRRWRWLAALILGFDGLTTVVYGAFLPLPPPLDVGISVPVLGRVVLGFAGLGALELAAAVGLPAARPWARPIAFIAIGLGVAYEIGFVLLRLTGRSSDDGAPPPANAPDLWAVLLGPTVALALTALVVWVLLRRWEPPRDDPGRSRGR